LAFTGESAGSLASSSDSGCTFSSFA